MFHHSSSQGSLFESTYQMSKRKHARLEKTWAQTYRDQCLSLIDEDLFRPLYCEDNGAPCKSIRVVVSALILKDVFDLTDAETQDALDFDLRWHLALDLDPCDDASHVAQRTFQYFRAKMLEQELVLLLFKVLSDRLLQRLGVKTGQQRLDTTHLLSNFAQLTRLGVFCETHRVFLRAVRQADQALLALVPETLRRRYLDDEGTRSHYDDARASECRRRLAVAARDAYRLCETFRGMALPPAVGDAYALEQRLLAEHCTLVTEPQAPATDDGDADLTPVPVLAKEATAIAPSSLQTPHDPEVTFSGHKGQGYEALIGETCDPTNPVQLITHISLERSCESDADRVLPVLDALAARAMTPETLLTDTGFGSTDNVILCAQRGIDLVAPQPGSAPRDAATLPEYMVDAREFVVQLVPTAPPSCCPAGVTALQTRLYTDPEAGELAVLQMPTTSCQACAHRGWCPALTTETEVTVVMLSLKTLLPFWRRAAEKTEAFRLNYKVRAGIEGTNSELKRGHGLGKLRVRGAPRVFFALVMKSLACNVKRALRYWGQTRQPVSPERVAEGETTTHAAFCAFCPQEWRYLAFQAA